MSQPVARDDFSRGEAAAGLVWLSVGALLSLALEVVYLGTPVGSALMPLTALGFNAVLTKTARLWGSATSAWVALVPLGVWLLGFFAALFALPALGFAPVPANASALVLLLGGVAGGVWPLLRAK